MTHTPRHARSRSSPHTMTDPAITIAAPDADGVMHVTAHGEPLGEIVKSYPRTWNITEHRPDVTTFYEAITTDGEFLDPVFATAEASGAALATLAGIRTTGANSQEHHR
jgi:hypothetical protein